MQRRIGVFLGDPPDAVAAAVVAAAAVTVVAAAVVAAAVVGLLSKIYFVRVQLINQWMNKQSTGI